MIWDGAASIQVGQLFLGTSVQYMYRTENNSAGAE